MKGWETEHGKCIANILRKYPNAAYLGKYSFPLQGSLGNAPTRDCTHYLKIVFVVAGGGFYLYYIHQRNKSDKERKIVRKRIQFYAYKKI